MAKVLTVLGARPQFIKAATVSRAIATCSSLNETIVHTGQHFDDNMSDVFFDELEIPAPERCLGISGGTHGVMTGRMLEALDDVIRETAPDLVVVYGDTNSTLAGALAAVKLGIPVAHVESGLRSFNKAMPEEVNRVLTDHCADFLFTPTDAATQNLHDEGVRPGLIAQVGDVMFDAALFYGERVDCESSSLLNNLNVRRGKYVLATIHRQENTDCEDRLRGIFQSLSEANREIPVVMPLHPRTKQSLIKSGLDPEADGLRIIAPVGYLDMVLLERGAGVVVTDSGGVQKEAYFHGVPCVTVRNETEWPELVDLGWNRLVPPENKLIKEAILSALGSKGELGDPYGDGTAATRIVDALEAATMAAENQKGG